MHRCYSTCGETPLQHRSVFCLDTHQPQYSNLFPKELPSLALCAPGLASIGAPELCLCVMGSLGSPNPQTFFLPSWCKCLCTPKDRHWLPLFVDPSSLFLFPWGLGIELPDVQIRFREGRGTRDPIANIHWIIEKARMFQKNIYFCFVDYTKAFNCVDHNKLWKIHQEMGIPEHLTCLLRNLYAGQEATVRTGRGTTDWFQIGKGVPQACILSPCLFNLYAEYIMWNAGLNEAQAGIKIAGRNINNVRYANDTTFMAESEEELKSLLMKVKEESEKVGLDFNIQKTKIMASGTITSWQTDGETMETVRDFYYLGLQNHCRWWLQPWN